MNTNNCLLKDIIIVIKKTILLKIRPIMKVQYFLLLYFWVLGTFSFAQQKDVFFEVIFNDEKIGTLHAKELVSGKKTVKNLSIDTDTKYLFVTVHVESEVHTIYENGILIEGTAYRDANHGSDNVQARVTKIGSKTYQRSRNGVNDKIFNKDITFCIIDLYFKEPVGITKVFSNMYAEMLTLKKVSPGKYQLITPDNNDSFYTYKNGKLVIIEVNIIAGKVLSKRI